MKDTQMPAEAAIHLTDTDINFALHFKELKEEGECCGLPKSLLAKAGGETINFSVLHGKQLAEHLADLKGKLTSLEQDEKRLTAASALLDDSVMVLKLQTEAEWTEELWQDVGAAAQTLDGIMLAFDSLILPSGVVLAGPLRQQHESVREIMEIEH
ncbi:MAG: hypothetical protein AAGG72_04920 [Pseudomonadota bacterium]